MDAITRELYSNLHWTDVFLDFGKFSYHNFPHNPNMSNNLKKKNENLAQYHTEHIPRTLLESRYESIV